MSGEPTEPARLFRSRGLSIKLTTELVVRQFSLLFIIGTLLLATVWFFNLYNIERLGGPAFFTAGNISFKYFELPAIVVFVYGYVFLIGILFALVPSERSFTFFFYGILAALVVVQYDHSVIDWVLGVVFRGSLRVPNPVSVIKVALVAGLLSTVILMHYNILSDDFTKRMIRRGIPTEEAVRIRPGIYKSLVPLLTSCTLAAVGLGLVGEFSALVFQSHGLFPKIEIVLLGAFGVVLGFILRSIIRELYQGGGDEETEERAETTAEAPNG